MARQRRPGRNRSTGSAGATEVIYGLHAVRAVLRNPRRRIRRLTLTGNAARRLDDDLRGRAIDFATAPASELSRLLGAEAVHQGAVVETEPLPEAGLDTVVEALGASGPAAGSSGPLVVLDQVTDPHNVGAVLRSAAAFSAPALVMARRHAPPVSGALAKAASGALEHVAIVRVANLARALADIGAAGVTRIGLDGAAPRCLEDDAPRGPCALVLGAEGKGLRRLTSENCDLLCRLTTTGPIASLNVSNAAAIALHVLALARGRPAPSVAGSSS